MLYYFPDTCSNRGLDITKHSWLTRTAAQRGWDAHMTSEKNGRQIMKAFLNNKGASNDIRPNFYATFDAEDQNNIFTILFPTPVTYLSEFRAELFGGAAAGTQAIIRFINGAQTVKTEVC